MRQKLAGSAGLAAFMLFLAGSAAAGADDPRMVDAMARQNREAVRALAKQGVDVNSRAADGTTALHWAAHWDDLDTVAFLLKAGAEIDAADDHGVTALSLAAENASVGMVEALLKAGANPNLAQKSGMTPLLDAINVGKPDWSSCSSRAARTSTPRRPRRRSRR